MMVLRDSFDVAIAQAREAVRGGNGCPVARPLPYGLTFRQLTILQLVAHGKRDKEIAHAVTECRDPQDACDLLVAHANQRGGVDNITVVLLAVEE